MTTIIYSHPACLGHDMGHGQPESAERPHALLARLDEPEFDSLERRSAPCAEFARLTHAHGMPYISKVFETLPTGG